MKTQKNAPSSRRLTHKSAHGHERDTGSRGIKPGFWQPRHIKKVIAASATAADADALVIANSLLG